MSTCYRTYIEIPNPNDLIIVPQRGYYWFTWMKSDARPKTAGVLLQDRYIFPTVT